MKSIILQKAPNERFNNLCHGDTLDRFSWFEIMPCRQEKSDDTVKQCEADQAEFWAIYGRENVGTADEPEFLAYAVHDETDVHEIVRIARQIALETGKGFVVGCVERGQFPRKGGQVTPVAEFTEIAEELSFLIFEEIGDVKAADQRVDDFENHSLSALREAFSDYSDYSGLDQLDPYQEVAA
jgi:hypothetical protein